MHDRRLLLLGLAVLVAAVVAGGAIAIGTRGSSDDETTTARTSTPEQAATHALLRGIPQRGLELGNADAPTVVEFADPQCPFCADWSRDVFPDVVRDYVRPGKVKLVFRGLHFVGPESEAALRVALAASLQNRLWNVVEGIYQLQGAENSGWVTDDLLRHVGAGVKGLDVDRMMSDRDSGRVTKLIEESDAEATKLGVRGTPSFYFSRPPAVPTQLQLPALDAPTFRRVLDAALAG